ncbi:hypothetical protein [Microbacterium sp. TNHR37B]|uniref:hypothetical protein n=1 Tax=Microbacterium sp. TNHR37B TaxID=1775956 RepID=UPI0007B28A9B|nr:hypothetical protein [Microbacterium sp. TNHR37B]KZE89562.1 hypothetical protein AVP41_02360 [Microbacterium sp. TNHR37B]
MFTVVILSDSARRIFARSEAFFAPFVERGEIAFCEWHDTARDARALSDVLPDLADTITGKAAWRAVVVDHLTPDAIEDRDPENPFDYAGNRDPDLSFVESPHPLVEVAHWLLGYPALTAKQFSPVVVWRGDDGQLHREAPEAEVAGMDPRDQDAALAAATQRLAGAKQQRYTDVAVQYEEIPHEAALVAEHRRLSEKYRMKEVHPSEVAFVCTRPRADDDETAQLRRAWQVGSERDSSRFVERNDYPVASRFAVYDLLNSENSGYAQDELRFWMSVLTLATNELPPGAFQADRVYELGVAINERRLGDLLEEQVSRLTALRDHMDSVIRRPSRPPEADAQTLLIQEPVTVEFDRLGGTDVGVSVTGYALASDIPRHEPSFWANDIDAASARAMQIFRRPRRILARAVFDTRRRARSFLDHDRVLNDIEREELDEELLRRVQGLAVPATTEILNRGRLASLLEEHRTGVARHIAGRMRLRTVAGASLLVLLAWIGAFAPYLIQAADKGMDALLWSAFTVAAGIVLLAVVALVTLEVMRRRLVVRVRRVNDDVQSFAAGVNDGAKVFGEYLTGLATYMRARSILIGSERWQERETLRSRRLIAVRDNAAESIAVQRDILYSLGRAPDVRRINLAMSEVDELNPHQIRSYFRFPTGDRTAVLNDSGQTIAAPYDFITAFLVERVRLFERSPREQLPGGRETE